MKLNGDTKVFCSYAFTGEDETVVQNRMDTIVHAFGELGISAYCNLHDAATETFTKPNEYILAVRKEIRRHDAVFVVQASERRSEGQLIEVGIALEREMPLIVAQHESAIGKSYLDTLADEAFTWTDLDSLVDSIRSLV